MVFFGITLIVIPIVLASKTYFFWYPLGIYGGLFFLWVAALLVIATVYGFCVGSLRVIEMLGHLWFSAYPLNHQMSERLWGIIAITGAVTYIGATLIKIL